ncbi:hypothetical protein [Streptomyces sp. NPDC101776]|uniref:hypothetical protein n=1 Tax=Streptomyces sp. NPDC101776 TaxID=3366146 RepID=UPI00380A967E
MRTALAQSVGAAPGAVHRLPRDCPPETHLSDHNAGRHIHFSRNGTPAERWAGRLIVAQLALIEAGDRAVTPGRCAAA